MKAIHLTLLFSLLILFSGCPYESDVAIDKPAVKVDPSLLGRWEDARQNGDQYKVSQQDTYTYQVVKTTRANQEPEKYLAYVSMVNGSTFMNVYQVNSKNISSSYALMKLTMINKGALNIIEVTNNVDEKFEKSEDLKKFISTNMKNSYFFSRDVLALIRTDK